MKGQSKQDNQWAPTQGSYPFLDKTSRTFQGLSTTHFPFFKNSIQCRKEPWVYVFFSSTTAWAILSWRSFILGSWESGLDKVSTEIQGLSSTNCNFQGLSRWVQTLPPPLTFTHSVPVFAGKFLFPLFLHLLKFGIISYWKKENNEFSQTKWFCYLCVLHPWRIKILKDAKHLIACVP